ncbi:MAG: DNA-directed RNA polymerase subunit beta' [Candidatus Taylorbacteria bacterium RIFCSPHIGHO2_01_FULL_45_63]|uniref:DNA-directed RNA polymerase subunit beta' n=1 Tax=Candidatus Taylorbacteria bacterium RIFCSPHIGHO2_02_FULL_45_35 TaxID=1802311 RepID=A0A1G2MXE3_9BACT|nr:MAG: DNA-directed RNA polymerase subunit beta' [Candidatus Taylorbacteria bacterium RIFCSPHIGHO2_01_FULL_45_63]OHA27869.1 MAG: DNA-directed RNA polymerase subunit beta' [Candidatus Taylorbacteria bacterium RIFCSPHIGHO2_02_FULL_45_35]OHA32431.1 MAG: DNA-directed RNA polymerase subunit beta' [Candidatus Taylorbacteria bacterium RIFCSPLOWO2_01_FULL_45_34b]
MIYNKQKTSVNVNNFDSIVLRLASPDRILEWSSGEVTKPETINYRTQRSEKNGLFDEKIFGPEKDFECYCGKYRGIRYKGIICEKCGVEITRAIVRRERMGHIELATPVSHIWHLRSTPSRMGLILGMPAADLEKVIYFAGYIVTRVFEEERGRILKDIDSEYKTKLKSSADDKTKDALKELMLNAKRDIESIHEGRVLDEVEYHTYSIKYGSLFEAGIGAEAIYDIFKTLDLKKLIENLEVDLEKAGALDREKITKRLSLVRSMNQNTLRPEWMFLTRIPVIPPALRPMVPLDGGRYATSDVNDLYRRVINRNNRLRKLLEIKAPDVILRNEKRILQEAVDSLIDNSIRHGNASAGAISQAQRRPLKSLSDNLKGKRGLFRSNLLGKRVDYSGRSVIVVGPNLKLHECGMPKHMALELFRPFVISKLLERELAYNIRGAGRLIEEGIPEVWAILEEVITGKYVLLNRAPTLHRLGIQAFQPVLIEGDAIQVHPLVCTAFNADFDGDQMAVHVPLGEEAQLEARLVMASDKNVLKPGSGDPIVSAKLLDIILGCYWMTKLIPGRLGEGKYFADPNSAITAVDFGAIDFRAKIKVIGTDVSKYKEFEGKVFETTAGRLLFNNVLPSDYPYINKEIDKKTMSGIVDDLISRYGIENIPDILDRVKVFGFKYATYSGTTWGIDDVVVPKGKYETIKEAKVKSEQITSQYDQGLLSVDERIRKNIEVWHGAKNDVEKLIPEALDPAGSVYDLWKSGARGSLSQITQMVGMKGLIATTAGDTIEFPILSSMKEGLTPIEYFITTHGSRKGLTDTALNTAKAGYLTRRLFDVAQDAIVTEQDCGTKESVFITNKSVTGMDISIAKSVRGRTVAEDVVLEKTGKVLFKKGHLLSKAEALSLEKSGVVSLKVRSPLNCKTLQGVCATCYGFDPGKDRKVDLGEAVGTVAAQAIGEPGTQLTMRTFHAGGTASVGGDITQGLPRVEEVFEKRKPKNPAAVSHTDGVITGIKDLGKEKVITVLPELGEKGKGKKAEIEYAVSFSRTPLFKVGDAVKKGDLITDGSADIDEYFKFAGKERTQNYIIDEVSKLYELQGETVARKHIEIIVRQMFSRRRVKDAGGTELSAGDVVDLFQLDVANSKAKEKDLEEAKVDLSVMGITEVSLSRKSFLSAASFQHTTRVLINASVRGYVDHLVGLKENVIIGRLIPAGTGFPGSPKHELIRQLHEKERQALLESDIVGKELA